MTPALWLLWGAAGLSLGWQVWTMRKLLIMKFRGVQWRK